MKQQVRALFTWEGTVDRGFYAAAGLVGFAIKHNLDRAVASLFGRPWALFNYWIPLEQATRITALPPRDAFFLLTMVTLSLPFIWVGVVLTLRRLRSVGWPSWPVALFFVPFVNLLFFLLLSLLPAGEKRAAEPRPGFLRRLIPVHPTGSAAIAILVTVLLGVAAAALSTISLRAYGWGLFVALPFCLGLTAALLYGYHAPRSARSCIVVALTSLGLLAGAFLALAFEGMICIAMVAPVAVPLTMLGGWVGYLIQRRAWEGLRAETVVLALLVALPVLMGAERATETKPLLFEVTTSLEIDAPPETVWRYVVSFAELPPPQEWYFRAGIAYPVRAEIHGRGPGATRYCVFSTGAFVEPITAWDEPSRLSFAVTATPRPMREWSPFATVEPAHLEGFFFSRRGEFRLVPLANGRTRLEGTTAYEHGLWPAGYWRLWSDAVIHRIHLRVLRHIRSLAERDSRK